MASSTLAFDELLAMAQEPERLEAYRQREVRSIIEQAPDEIRRRLRGLQFQIDAHRTQYNNNPIGACVQLSKMMHESFFKLQTHLSQAASETAALPRPATKHSHTPLTRHHAKVIFLPLKHPE